MKKQIKELKDKNVTRLFFRYLKENNAFSTFNKAIQHGERGKPLYETFYALKFDPNGKKERFHDDPLKWIMARREISAYDFIGNIINEHINWDETEEGFKYWSKLHNKWKFVVTKFLTSNDPTKEMLHDERIINANVSTINNRKKSLKNRITKLADNVYFVIFVSFILSLICTLIIRQLAT